MNLGLFSSRPDHLHALGGDERTLRMLRSIGSAIVTSNRLPYLMCKVSVECEMRLIAWAILAILSSSIPSIAQPVLLAGRYVLPITQHDLYVSAPGPLGTTVTVNFRFKPIGSCTDTLDGVLEYQLPPGYKGEPVNEAKATCNKTIQCSGVEFKCIGAKQAYPMSFQHVPLREIKVIGGSFSGTYRYVSLSIERSRTALLRRASVGNFEVVDESADRKVKTVRFRIER